MSERARAAKRLRLAAATALAAAVVPGAADGVQIVPNYTILSALRDTTGVLAPGHAVLVRADEG